MKEMRRKFEFAMGELEKHINEESRSLRSESIDVRTRIDSLKDTLSKYEDIIDKRINTDIMLRIDRLDTLVSDIDQNIAGFKSSTSSTLAGHETKIVELISSTEEHRSTLQSHTSAFSSVETRLISQDKKTKAVAESMLISSEGQFKDMRNQYDAKIAELVSVATEHGGALEGHSEALSKLAEDYNRIDQNLLQTNKDVEELKKQGEEDRGLVVMKFKETKDSLESFFERLETFQSTQTKEVSFYRVPKKKG